MPVTDLAQVTTTLRRLVEQAVVPPPAVSTTRPDTAQTGDASINIYCYHVAEDPHNRLRPRPGGKRATSPLTLEMFYIVSVRLPSAGGFDALAEQRLLGRAMKAFHDHAVIDDGTAIGPDRVLPEAIRDLGNRFEIAAIRPGTGANAAPALPDSPDPWSARPAACYAVRPVELMPERPARIPGIVLSVGTTVTPADTPALGATESTVPYILPTPLGGGPATLTATPAQLGPVTPEGTQVMTLRGTALSRGTAHRLLLAHAGWSARFPDRPRLPVDPALNPGWTLDIDATRIVVTADDALTVALPEGGTEALPLYPGAYSASLEISDPAADPLGPPATARRTNTAALTVVPRITGASRDGVTGAVALSFGGGWRLDRGLPTAAPGHEGPALDILLSVDGAGYDPESAPVPSLPGRFAVAAQTLTYLPRPAQDAPGVHAVTVVIEGAPAQPFWVEIA